MHDTYFEIGRRLRALRRERRLSQREVAERSGVSKGTVSKVESGRSLPTLPMLLRLLEAMDYQAGDFFAGFRHGPEHPAYVLRRAAEARPHERELASRGFDYLQLLEATTGEFAVRAVILTIEPDSRRDKLTTDAYEFKYILSGRLDYEIGEETLQLAVGDSLFYDGRIPHVPHNRSAEPARMLVVYLYDKLLTDS